MKWRRPLPARRRVRPWPSAGGARRVVITGAAGRIGRILRAGLSDDYAIRGLDVRRGPGADIVVDLARTRRLDRLFEGADTVIDLAGDPRVELEWSAVRENNISCTLNVLEAARLAGVRRVVYASSNHVTGMYEREEPYASIVAGTYRDIDPATLPRIDSGAAVRPDSFYAVGKVAGEAAARLYADEHGLSVICLRIGHVNPEDRPKQPNHYATLLTRRDLLQLVRRCIDAPPSLRFAVLYGVSANTWRIWDLDEARAAVGFEPEDDAERLREPLA